MISDFFLRMALFGAEWVLYILIIISLISIAVIIDRWIFYKKARQGIDGFRERIRKAASGGDWKAALEEARKRKSSLLSSGLDFETPLTLALLENKAGSKTLPKESLSEIAQDALLRTRIEWDRNLSVLATIGSNAPFVGLFGTVLGIIQAFHDLSQKSGTGVQTVTAGISEALIATGVGILVAIPAVVAYNLFSRKVKTAIQEAEALKSYLLGHF